MRGPIPIFILLPLMVAAFASASHAAGVSDLIFITEEFKPYNYTEDGQARGLSVDLLKLIWKNMGVAEQPIVFLPWARGYEMAQNDKMTALFATLKTPGRKDLFKWVGPIVKARTILVKRADNPATLSSLKDAYGQSIAIVRDYASTTLLSSHADGIKIVTMKSMDKCLRMLLAGRVDFISAEERMFHRLIKRHGLSSTEFKTALVYHVDESYYAFSKDVPDTLIARLQKALDSILKTAAYRNLVNHYVD